MTAIGAMKARIVLLAPSDAPDGGGGWIRTWTPIAPPSTVFADVRRARARPGTQGRLPEGEFVWRFRLRLRPGLAPGMRISWKGRIFEVGSAADDEKWTRLMAREVS